MNDIQPSPDRNAGQYRESSLSKPYPSARSQFAPLNRQPSQQLLRGSAELSQHPSIIEFAQPTPPRDEVVHTTERKDPGTNFPYSGCSRRGELNKKKQQVNNGRYGKSADVTIKSVHAEGRGGRQGGEKRRLNRIHSVRVQLLAAWLAYTLSMHVVSSTCCCCFVD